MELKEMLLIRNKEKREGITYLDIINKIIFREKAGSGGICELKIVKAIYIAILYPNLYLNMILNNKI